MANAAVDFAAIGFQLGFAGTAGADAAAELRHLHAASRQSRQQVLQLRQFHLELAFTGARVAGKDVEDELGAIDDAQVELALQVALLRWRQLVIEDDEVGRTEATAPFSSSTLPLPMSVAGSGLWRRCRNSPMTTCPCAGGQLAQLGHRLFGGKSVVFLIVEVQVSGGGAARHAGARRNFPGGLLPGARAVGLSDFACRSSRNGFGVARCRPGGEFHSHQEDSFRLAPAGLPGAVIRSGVHSTRARNGLVLGGRCSRSRHPPQPLVPLPRGAQSDDRNATNAT